MSEIKLCKDCKWFRPAPNWYALQQMNAQQNMGNVLVPTPQPEKAMCIRPLLMRDDLVNGGVVPYDKTKNDPELQRSTDCGMEAKYFEPKPVSVAPPPVNHFAGIDPCGTLAKPWWMFWR